MSEPETPAHSPSEPTAPHSNPKPEPEKKPDRKMDPSVMVAVIGAAVTIITAALSSPLLLTLVGRMNAPAPTAAAAAILPSLASSTDPVPSASATPSALTDTVALPTPESTPTPATSQPASLFECIASDTWTPYPSNLNPNESNGCWELADWGLTTQDGQLRIDHTPTQPQQRGIYLPLSGNMDVHFTVQFDEFRVRSNRQALLTFGVVQREPFSHFSGGFSPTRKVSRARPTSRCW